MTETSTRVSSVKKTSTASTKATIRVIVRVAEQRPTLRLWGRGDLFGSRF